MKSASLCGLVIYEAIHPRSRRRRAPAIAPPHPMTLNPLRSTRSDHPEADAAAEYYVLGGSHLGVAVAEGLRAAGHAPTIVDKSYAASDIPGLGEDPADLETLRAVDPPADSTVVVATSHDRRNLLIAQQVRAHFGVDSTLVLANTPDGYEVLEAAGHDPICATTALSEALLDDA